MVIWHGGLEPVYRDTGPSWVESLYDLPKSNWQNGTQWPSEISGLTYPEFLPSHSGTTHGNHPRYESNLFSLCQVSNMRFKWATLHSSLGWQAERNIYQLLQDLLEGQVSSHLFWKLDPSSLMAWKGMDLVILKLSLDALSKAGFPTKVLPGRLAFKPEEKLQVVTGRDIDITVVGS